jgi:hypothetical protein
MFVYHSLSTPLKMSFLDSGEIHVAFGIHATCHLHGIAGNCLGEVFVDKVLERGHVFFIVYVLLKVNVTFLF